MRVTIDRNLCNHSFSECARCFARFVSNPRGKDYLCIAEYVEDGDPVLRLTLRCGAEEEVFDLMPEE